MIARIKEGAAIVKAFNDLPTEKFTEVAVLTYSKNPNDLVTLQIAVEELAKWTDMKMENPIFHNHWAILTKTAEKANDRRRPVAERILRDGLAEGADKPAAP